jgi:alcohol dehydrogenase YqhD (iron-dependent ADH family)
MQNFTSYNPTKVHFGKGVVEKLGVEAAQYGRKALIVIGRGSVKTNGVLDAVFKQLETAGVTHVLFEGIKSNPIYQDVDSAIAVAEAFGAEMVVAVGGGSVVDSAKAVAIGVGAGHSVWDFYTRTAPAPTKGLPLLCVLTLAATGTEQNRNSVIQNDADGRKMGYSCDAMYPKVSFLDPEYTVSVPANYTAYGISDLISHVLEQYVEPTDSPLSNYIATDIIKLAFEHGRKLMADLTDYDARANILWLSTMALNGTLSAGKRGGDWGVHGLEHSLSVLYDIPHGAGLSIIYPSWIRAFRTELEPKLDFMAKRVLSPTATGDDFLNELEGFYKEINSPTRLSEANIPVADKAKILENFALNKVVGGFYKMDEAKRAEILDLAWGE